jgi:hypothetical protein
LRRLGTRLLLRSRLLLCALLLRDRRNNVEKNSGDNG